MCTVTFLPGPSGYILTHNRDEAPSRSPNQISQITHPQAGELLFPKDTLKSGSWIAAAPGDLTVCLLNGAFEKHTRELPYRRSRGLVLLDFFDAPTDADFFDNYNFDGIEPFTFLVIRPKNIHEFRWDGKKRYLAELNNTEAHFWCSATLYPAGMREKRKAVFEKWIETDAIKNAQSIGELADELLQCHTLGSVGDPENNFVMNRDNKVQTVSITQVVTTNKITRMNYFDLLGGHTSSINIELAPFTK